MSDRHVLKENGNTISFVSTLLGEGGGGGGVGGWADRKRNVQSRSEQKWRVQFAGKFAKNEGEKE
jgi:hypothetical protein